VFLLDQRNLRPEDGLDARLSKEGNAVDLSEYAAEAWIRDTLAGARADAAQWALYRAARPPRRRVRHAVGRLLLRLGHRLGEGADLSPLGDAVSGRADRSA